MKFWINRDKTEGIRLDSIDSWVLIKDNELYDPLLTLNIHGFEVDLVDDEAEEVYKILLSQKEVL